MSSLMRPRTRCFRGKSPGKASKQRTSSNTQTGIKVVESGEERSVWVQGHIIGPDEAIEGNDDDKEGVQPIDVLEPVGPSEGLVANVRRLLLGHGRGQSSRRHCARLPVKALP